MTFKENLLKKIRIDLLSNKVNRSFNKAESPIKIDKEAIKELLGYKKMPRILSLEKILFNGLKKKWKEKKPLAQFSYMT